MDPFKRTYGFRSISFPDLIYLLNTSTIASGTPLVMFADDTTVMKEGKRVYNLVRQNVDCMFD